MGEIQGTLLQHPQLFLFLLHLHHCFLHLHRTILLELHYRFHFVMLRDFYVPHGHSDLRVPQDLLQNRHIGPGQNGPGSERVAEIVEIDGAP